MTGWLFVLAFAGVAAAVLIRSAGRQRGAAQMALAALLVGATGYAWQGSPGLRGRATPPTEGRARPASLFSFVRPLMMPQVGPDADLLAAAEGLHAQGADDFAAGIIRARLVKVPNDADLWVGLANALMLHADGFATPASDYALARARSLAPWHPGPDLLAGIGQARAGNVGTAIATWSALLARSPARARWRPAVAALILQAEAVEPAR